MKKLVALALGSVMAVSMTAGVSAATVAAGVILRMRQSVYT